jgi:Protein of unknown function (DUF3106)
MQGRIAVLALLMVVMSVVAPSGVMAFPTLAQNWRELSPGERYDTLRNYQEHERLPEDSQREIEKRYERWQRMSPDERERIRQNYERMQQLSPRERDRLQRKYEKWRQQGEPSH